MKEVVNKKGKPVYCMDIGAEDLWNKKVSTDTVAIQHIGGTVGYCSASSVCFELSHRRTGTYVFPWMLHIALWLLCMSPVMSLLGGLGIPYTSTHYLAI